MIHYQEIMGKYLPDTFNSRRTAGMYFNMARTNHLEMCSLGPSNPPPLPLPPTTLSPYLVYYSDFNGTEKSQTKWKIRFTKDILDCSKHPPPPNCMVSILWKSNYTQLLIYSGVVTQNFLVVSVIWTNHPPSCHHKYILSSKWNSITSNSHPILVGFIYILDSSLAFDLVSLLLAQLVTTQMIEWLTCHFAVDKFLF